MSDYIVTARKWRPVRFEDVVGQEHVTTTLRNALTAGRLAHAYIFSGPRGVGKTTTARLLAKTVNCHHPENADPDNTCESCREINEGRSFDVLEIDGASNRGVEEIRNLRESVRYAPSKSPRKVYIIDEVHMLTKEAFNALLKTLEEPPAHVLFIFATTELHKLPATILSRCQRFEFRRIPVEQIKGNLAAIARAEGLTLDEESLQLIARRGDGSLRDAQSAFDMVISLCGTTVTHELILQALNVVDQELYFRVTDLVKERNTAGALALVQEVVDRGYDLKEFVGGLVEHFRNLLVARATGSTKAIEASDVYRRRYAEDAQKFSLTDLLRFQRLVSGTDASFRWVAQPRFRLEADMVLLTGLPAAAEVGEVLKDIDELKKKLAEAPDRRAPPAGFSPARNGVSPVPRPVSPGDPAPPTPEARRVRPLPPRANGSARPGAAPPPAANGARTGPAPALNGAEVLSRWKEFIEFVRQRRISLGTVIDLTEPVGVEGSMIRVNCPDQFQAEAILRNREALSDLLQELFHVRARLDPVVEQASGSGAASPATPPPAQEEHPVIQALKRELGAEPMQQ